MSSTAAGTPIRLSIVVANAVSDPAVVAPSVAALAAESDPDRDQWLWVDRAGLDPSGGGGDGFVRVEAPAAAGRGDLYGLGLSLATAPVVAFTDSTTVFRPGWRRAVEAAFGTAGGDGVAVRVAGGPVLPVATRNPVAWAGFLLEYGPHAVPPYTSATGDVAGNNVAYARDALGPFEGGPLWKTVANAVLRGQGIEPVVVPGMRVEVSRPRWAPSLTRGRSRSGCLYARQRAEGWRRRRRMARGLACVVLPPVLFLRLGRQVWHDRGLRSQFLLSAPLVAVGCAAWSAGEALGYLVDGMLPEGVM